MEWIDVGAVLVAVIAALGALAAQRSAAKASKVNTTVSGRLDAEKGAYQRARAIDVETIERQTREIISLRDDNESLRRELQVVKKRLRRLEHLTPDVERLLDAYPEEDGNQE